MPEASKYLIAVRYMTEAARSAYPILIRRDYSGTDDFAPNTGWQNRLPPTGIKRSCICSVRPFTQGNRGLGAVTRQDCCHLKFCISAVYSYLWVISNTIKDGSKKLQTEQAGRLKPGADPADIIRKFEKVYTNIFASESSGSMYVAREIENCIREKQKFGELCILGITTGKSPVGVFRALVEIHKKENLSFRNVVVFSLDEFFPISPKEQQSRNWLIHESLLDHVDILPENIHIPDGTLPQDKVAAFCRDYEAKIEEYGGLDLLFLGTGVQGQLGFNEPGSYTNTRTRLVALGNESRQAVSSIFYGIDNVPRKAITMGLERSSKPNGSS